MGNTQPEAAYLFTAIVLVMCGLFVGGFWVLSKMFDDKRPNRYPVPLEPPMVANVPEDPEPRPPLKPVSCGNCHFYDDDGDGSGEGVCMRYPPVVVHDAETMAETWWPDVDDTDWCGEFKPKNPLEGLASQNG